MSTDYNYKRSFLRNFSSLTGIQLMNYFVPLLTLPYLAGTIGSNGFGILGLAAAIAAYVLTITDFGFSYSGTREIARVAKNKRKVSICYSEILCAKVFLFLLSLSAALIICLFVPILRNNIYIIFLTNLYIIGQIFFSEFLFQGIEKMEKIAIMNFFVKIISVVMIFAFVKNPEDIYIVPLSTFLGYIVSGIVAFKIVNLAGYKFYVSRKIIKRSFLRIRDGKDIFISILMPNFYNNLSTIILAFVAPISAVGYFDLTKKIISIPEQLISIFNRVFFPIVSKDISRHKNYLLLGLAFSLLICCGLYFFSSYMVLTVFGEEYERVAYLLKCFSIAPILLFLSSAYGTSYLFVKGHEALLRNIVMLSSLVSLFVAIVLIPEFKEVGVVVTISAARGLMFLVEFYVIKKNKF